MSADISGEVSKISGQVIIEGSLLVFCPGEWTATYDGEFAALGRLRDQSPDSQMRFKERIEASFAGLQHRYILRCFGYITTGDIVYSVNSWIANGNIRDYIRRNPEADRLRLLGQVASGVEFLHERKIVHGDICGKNILIDGDGKAVVCGFGLADCSNPNLDLSRARWFAPEKITSASVSLPTEKGDIWSFGLLCLEVFTGEDPYSSSPDLYVPVLLSRGRSPEHPGSKAVGLRPNMWELMQSCWMFDPAVRPSMRTIHTTIREMCPRRKSRQQSSGSLDQPFQTPLTRANDSMVSTGASFGTTPTSLSPQSKRATTEYPLTSRDREPDLSALLLSLPIEDVDQQTETPNQTWHSTPSPGSGRLAPLVEEPLDLETGPPSTPSSSVRGRRQSNLRPYTASSPSTSSAPSTSYPIPSDPRQFAAKSSSLQSPPITRESGARRRWSLMSHIRPRTNLNKPPDVNGAPLSPSTPNGDTLHVQNRAPQVNPSAPSRAQTAPTSVPDAEARISRSAPLLVPLPRRRRREPLSQEILEFLERVVNDSENLVHHPADGSVSAGNLEDLISRVIIDTADPSEDSRFRHAFLTVYQLFATSERLFEILKRRFGSMELDPRAAHIRTRFNILVFIDRWLRKGFEDEELKCSERIKEFALSIRGSGTMEVKAQEIASLIDNPDYVGLRQPGSCARLRREPAERPRGLTPADLAAALTVVEGERFKYITHWDYANFIRGRPNAWRGRIEVFSTVHDLVTVWVKRTVLDSDDLGDRMKKYEEWIHAAKECQKMNNFSSTVAIVKALTSSAITRLVMTCESRANPILHELAREVASANGLYQNTLKQVATKDLIPWLDPLLPPLNSTFTLSNLIVEVDGRPLIDFKQCIGLAEQIDSLLQYSPPLDRSAMRSEVLAYVEYSLKSCDGDDVLRWIEVRSIEVIGEERTLLDRRQRMQSLGMAWAPPPQRRR